nr:hypothetical protein [Tanacetum cinerariifolium]
MLSLHIRCPTDESTCYRYTSDVQRMSRYAIVTHLMSNGGVDMLSLYIRCPTDESICYRYTSDVQRRSRYAIVVHQMSNGGVDMLSLDIRCPTDELICYCWTLDVHRLNYDENSRQILLPKTPAKYSRQILPPKTLLFHKSRLYNNHKHITHFYHHNHTKMVNMVPHEAFACSCAEGDVVLRQSYKPESCGKLYYACQKSKPPKHFGCGFFLRKETRIRQLMSSPGAPSAGPSTHPNYSSGPSTPPSYSSGLSTPPNYSSRSSRNAECSNCKHLRGKISVLKATMNMHMYPEQHTVNSAALLYKVLNEMEKLDLE